MKKDKLLQHQLRRLDNILHLRNLDMYYPTAGDWIWFNRFSAIYQGVVKRSLKRFATSL